MCFWSPIFTVVLVSARVKEKKKESSHVLSQFYLYSTVQSNLMYFTINKNSLTAVCVQEGRGTNSYPAALGSFDQCLDWCCTVFLV